MNLKFIKSRLTIIKETHPNIFNLWNKYIDEKIESMLHLLSNCRNTLDMIENENLQDLSQDNILALLMIISFNNERDMT